jgi:hypothetical protein
MVETRSNLSYNDMERTTGIEPATCRGERWQCHPFEPARRTELRPPPYRGGMLTVATKQA